MGQYQSKLSIWKKLAEGRRNNEFISEFLLDVPIKVELSNSENVDGDFVKGLMICNIYLAIQIKMALWIEIHIICLINSRKLLEALIEMKFHFENYRNWTFYTPLMKYAFSDINLEEISIR